MVELDEISMTLGKLLAGQDESARVQKALFAKFDEMRDQQLKTVGAVELLAADHAVLKAKVVVDIEPAVKDFKELKQRGLGALAFVGLLGGGAVVGFQKLLASLTGHGP